MPKTTQELINELEAKIIEGRKTIREMNESRAAALDVVKKSRQLIRDSITQEVQDQVGEMREAVSTDMRHRIEEVMDRIETDWRKALKLDQ